MLIASESGLGGPLGPGLGQSGRGSSQDHAVTQQPGEVGAGCRELERVAELASLGFGRVAIQPKPLLKAPEPVRIF